MAILTTTGRSAIAKAIAEQPIHFAWGTGDPAWDNNHVGEAVTASGLVAEVGRRLATSVQFVVADSSGDVIVPVFNDANGSTVERRFTVVNHITNNLYMRFNFDFADASASDIREVAIFIGTQVAAGLPVGQKYFTPAQVTDPGTMLAVENLIESIKRTPNSRQSFEFVLTI